MNFSGITLLLLLPVIGLQIALQIWATMNLLKTPVERLRWHNKLAWGVIIWVFALLGPLAYFSLSAKE